MFALILQSHARGTIVRTPTRIASAALLSLTLLFALAANSFAQKRSSHSKTISLTKSELKQAQARLAEMAYGKGGLIAFQKYEGRKPTGQLNRAEFDAIMNASAPQAKDAGYKHVEVDLDR